MAKSNSPFPKRVIKQATSNARGGKGTVKGGVRSGKGGGGGNA